MNTIRCTYCGAQLDVTYWHGGKPYCNIHCLLNWNVAEDIRKARAADPQQALHFTNDSPATVE